MSSTSDGRASRHSQAAKVFKKYVRGSKFLPKELQGEIATSVEEFDFAAQNMFMKVEEVGSKRLSSRTPPLLSP